MSKETLHLGNQLFAGAACALPPSLDEHLNILKLKGIELLANDFPEAGGCAIALSSLIRTYTEEYLKHNLDKTDYQLKCQEAFNQARPVLAQHRGVNHILANIGLAILGFGVFYVAAGLINSAITGNFLFFKKTHSEQISDKVLDDVSSFEVVVQ